MPDMTWICHECPFTTKRLDLAMDHAEGVGSHCLYLHDHWRGNPPVKSMHSSDWGGCYVDAVTPAYAAQMTRWWRERGMHNTPSGYPARTGVRQ